MKYNVGDRVRIKSLDWYNDNKDTNGGVRCKECTFTNSMTLYCNSILTIENKRETCYWVKENLFNWTDEMIEGLVEEEEIEFTEEDKYWCDIMSESDPTTYVLPEGYIFKDENGNVINATKIVLEKKKNKYPKTYEECCKVMGVNHTNDLDICEHCDYKTEITYYEDSLLEKIEALYRIRICRDAYWKIAGEEMGLGKPWEPDWKECSQSSHCIIIRIDNFNHLSHILVFPTPEMRDAFKENFDKDLEFCKEFL